MIAFLITINYSSCIYEEISVQPRSSRLNNSINNNTDQSLLKHLLDVLGLFGLLFLFKTLEIRAFLMHSLIHLLVLALEIGHALFKIEPRSL